MIWVIASIPFWIIGTFAFVVAMVGCGATFRDSAGMKEKEFEKAVFSILGLLLLAGFTFLFAAKIAS